MFVGDGSVGKTSLIHHLTTGLRKGPEFSVATDGIEMTVWFANC